MIVFTFVLACLVFLVALGFIIYWDFFGDAEDYFYRSLICLIVMSIVPILLPIWNEKVFSPSVMYWIAIISSTIAILTVVIYVLWYIFDSINDFNLRLTPFIIPILISFFVIFYTIAPEFLESNFLEIISCLLGVIGIVVAFVSFFSYRKRENNLKKELLQREREMRYRCTRGSSIEFRNLSKQEILEVEKVLAELYMVSKNRRLSTSAALDILRDSEISAELVHRIMERLFSNDFVEMCSVLTLTDFLEEILPELYASKRSYRSYSMDMRYYEDLYQRLRHTINFENNKAIDDINTKLDTLNIYIKTSLKSATSNTSSAEAHGRQNQIRELFHALETPIATSEMALATLKASFESLSELQDGKFDRIENALKLIKSILFAYRELTFMNIYSDENTFFSLPDIINSIPSLMTKNLNGNILDQRNIPNNLPQYSTNLIVVLLLPLINNAIEASPENKRVLIEYSQSDKGSIITIENHCKQTPRQVNLDTEGYSSKGNNHVGSGISIVKRISKSAGVDFVIKVNNNKVHAELTFPHL